MRPDDAKRLSTEQLWDYLEHWSDPTTLPAIFQLKERMFLAQSAAKLWFAHTAGEIREKRDRLDAKARQEEWHLG